MYFELTASSSAARRPSGSGGLGDLELIEPQRRGHLPADVDADRLADERRQRRLVLVRELDAPRDPIPTTSSQP